MKTNNLQKAVLLAIVAFLVLRQPAIQQHILEFLKEQGVIKTAQDPFVDPDPEIIAQVQVIKEKLKGHPEYALEICQFYLVFSDIVGRDVNNNYFKNPAIFRKYNIVALDLMFQNSDFLGTVPGLDVEIDRILAEDMGLNPENVLDTRSLGQVLYGISWAAYKAN